MTKIWLMSDLHQEFLRDTGSAASDVHTAFDPALHVPAEFDVVVAAGDIDVTVLRSLRWLGERFQGVPTVYVMGNHCAYSQALSEEGPRTIDELTDMGLELADRLGIHMLSDTSVVIDGVRFAGGTLWTDMSSVGHANVRAKAAQAAGRLGMNDYRRIRRWSSTKSGKRKRFRPEDSIGLHERTRSFIESELSTPHHGATVVVTHHAPHPKSLDDGGKGSMDWCYASNLSSMPRGADGTRCLATRAYSSRTRLLRRKDAHCLESKGLRLFGRRARHWIQSIADRRRRRGGQPGLRS